MNLFDDLCFTCLYEKERDLDKLVTDLNGNAVVFVRDLGKETGRFFKISKTQGQIVVKDEKWTNRQRAVLEKTLASKRVLLTGALGSGKTLITISRVIAAIKEDPDNTLVLYWIVSCRFGKGVDIKLFEKVRSAVASSLSEELRDRLDLGKIIDCRFIGEKWTELNNDDYVDDDYVDDDYVDGDGD